MAFMKSAKIGVSLLLATLTLVACAKRDSGLAARRNGAGAAYVNGQQAAEAEAAAAASGYQTDIMKVERSALSANGTYSINSEIKVNDTRYQVTTTHSQVGVVSSTSANFAGATFEVSGVCGSDTCSPYFLVINITRNGQRVLQTSMKKNFDYTGPDSTQDLVMSLGPNEFLSIQDIVNTLSQAVVE